MRYGTFYVRAVISLVISTFDLQMNTRVTRHGQFSWQVTPSCAFPFLS